MNETNPPKAVGAPLERQVRPVAEVCGPDICQDHAGPVEALSFLPTGTALYDSDALIEVADAERARCIAVLRALKDRSGINDNGCRWREPLTRGDCVAALLALGPNA